MESAKSACFPNEDEWRSGAARTLRSAPLRRGHLSQLVLRTAGLAALSLLLGSTLAAQSGARYDRQIQAYVHNGDFSGSVLVARDGRIVFQKSYGMANHEWGIPNSDKTKFHVASVTKTFTAAAILQLERAGKLKLDDPLSKYIPDFLNGERITIEQMLTHTSGLLDFYSLPEYPLRKYQKVTLPDLVAWVKTKPLDFFPGSKSSYSNTGYAFLAYIIEQVSGKPYEQFLTEEILKPAGMKDTGAFRDDTIIANRATGYQPAFDDHGLRNAPAYDKTILTGSGSLYSTTADLYEWCRVVEANKFFNVHDPSRAYGWGARETKTKHKYIEQSGRDPGFSSHIAVFPEDRLICDRTREPGRRGGQHAWRMIWRRLRWEKIRRSRNRERRRPDLIIRKNLPGPTR